MLHNISNTLSLVFRSLMNRGATAILTVASIAVSAALLSVVDRVRTDAQTSFANTISGTDLIVGARSGDLNLLLYSVFRIGNPTNNISWDAYEMIGERPEVAWTIPFSLGDAHRGYRVLGTDHGYFDHYQYADERSLAFAHGEAFSGPTDAVIGAEVAERLEYEVGRQIVVSHGLTETSFVMHDENPFTVTGILERTGTPVDRTVHITLSGMDLIHSDGSNPAAVIGYEPNAITAFLVGLESKISIFGLQRFINELEDEPLSAVIPGVALQQLWGLIGVAEYALFGVSAMVVLAGILGLLATLLVSLNERRREMSVLRSVGARPGHIFSLLLSEAAMLAFLGALTGLFVVQLGILMVRNYALSEFGIQLGVGVAAIRYVRAGGNPGHRGPGQHRAGLAGVPEFTRRWPDGQDLVEREGSMTTSHRILGQIALLLFLASGSSMANDPRELSWDELIPEGEELVPPQNPHGAGVTDEDLLNDDDWDEDEFEQAFSTPVYPVGVVEELDGIQAKIPGFVVPLEISGEGMVKEFLLVPYFGACIHYPPPPPNQIVYVILDDPIDLESTWAPIWATGELTTEFKDSGLGSAGYTLMAQTIEEYEY